MPTTELALLDNVWAYLCSRPSYERSRDVLAHLKEGKRTARLAHMSDWKRYPTYDQLTRSSYDDD